MYPSDHFFLKALFLRGPSAEFGGLRGFQAQGCVAKEPFESSNLLAMDFSRAGVVEALEGVFRARVQCRQDGHKFVCPGPRRPTREAAEEDLESMRAAASGMSREDGFAAMKVEADALKAGKPPKECGYIDRDGNSFRAHVEHREEGAKRHIPGPWRPDEEAAKGDLVSMRAAATGLGREDGFAAMDAEAKRLIAGKASKAEGSVKRFSAAFAALIRWKVGGEERRAYGPRRSEERRAEEDLECMREASSKHEDVLASRKAVDVEVRRLQQQAETERRVEIFGYRLSREQAQQQQNFGQRQQQQPSVGQRQRQQQLQQMSAYRHQVEEDSESQSDWEPGEADDADVVYSWERFDDRGRSLAQQQENEGPLLPIPEPRSADEASLRLAQFRPFKRTPEELKRLLEARANPDIVIPTETWGMRPLEKVLMAKGEHVPIFSYTHLGLIPHTDK